MQAMSAEQGDVKAIREALAQLDPFKTGRAFAALDRLVAALKRAERERDEAWRAHELAMKAGLARGARAEKAELALAEMREALLLVRPHLAKSGCFDAETVDAIHRALGTEPYGE